uniref:Cnidarian restricted protein n=1 Tax=Clytia hemisphaerica TaxID=252671 RepID=A0A7M5X852_9CNID
MFVYFKILLFLSFLKYLSNYEIAATYIRENEDKENFRENDFSKSFDNPKLVLLDNFHHPEHRTQSKGKDNDMQTLLEDDSAGSENGYSLDESKVQHLESMKDADFDEEEYERLDEDWIQKVAADEKRKRKRNRRRRRRRRRRRTLISLPVRSPPTCVETDTQICRWLLVNGELKFVCERVPTITCN